MKKTPGRPRVHEVGKWTCVQFRLPFQLRTDLLEYLEEKNNNSSYNLSLNSLLLELINKSLNEEKDKLSHEKSENK